MNASSLRPFVRLPAALLGSLLALTVALRATEGGFAATLSVDQQTAAGFTVLSPVELLTLDQLVAGELASVRRAGANELAGSFVSRRTDAELKATGLDRLSFEQLVKLNEFVAAALAAHPRPKERPRLKESDVLAAARQNQIHGSVTVAYGWGGGRSVRAESLWLDYYDPEDRFALGVGLSNSDGGGFYRYSPDYSGGGYYENAPVYFDASSQGGGSRGDFNFGEGQCFRGGGQACGHGGHRGH